jgi:hypothetical protein
MGKSSTLLDEIESYGKPQGKKTSLEGSIPCLIQGTFSGQPPRGQNDLGEIISIKWGIRYTGIPNNKPLEDGLFSWAYHIQKKQPSRFRTSQTCYIFQIVCSFTACLRACQLCSDPNGPQWID